MPRVQPFYAVKCNPHSGMVCALAGLGCGFDCASGSEVDQVVAAGIDPGRIIFANTCKTPEDLRAAAVASVRVRTSKPGICNSAPRTHCPVLSAFETLPPLACADPCTNFMRTAHLHETFRTSQP